MSERCPSCGTEFPVEKAPWLQKKLHCAKHDFVYPVGSTCSACDGEKEAAKAQAATAEEAKAAATGSSVDADAHAGG